MVICIGLYLPVCINIIHTRATSRVCLCEERAARRHPARNLRWYTCFSLNSTRPSFTRWSHSGHVERGETSISEKPTQDQRGRIYMTVEAVKALFQCATPPLVFDWMYPNTCYTYRRKPYAISKPESRKEALHHDMGGNLSATMWVCDIYRPDQLIRRSILEEA